MSFELFLVVEHAILEPSSWVLDIRGIKRIQKVWDDSETSYIYIIKYNLCLYRPILLDDTHGTPDKFPTDLSWLTENTETWSFPDRCIRCI